MMRLTLFSDYSLRVLIYLGLKGSSLVTIAEIADAFGISRNHLMKVVQNLATLGYVETVRGKGGGLRLSRPPEEVNLGAVLRSTEEGISLVECFDLENCGCRIVSFCSLPGMFNKALEAFFSTLEQYTLADLLQRRHQLAPALGVPLIG